ncbi:MAG: hypothetical protein K2I12_00555, partial [Duncaniella sp.]|nr:hypothetical protein [Duncaniella sp.]
MKAKRTTFVLLAAIATACSLSAWAQDYYDDDIYFDASKAPKPEPKQVKQQPQQQNTYTYYITPDGKLEIVPADYPSADNFTVNGTRTISVDDYNRRGIFAASDSLPADTASTDFAYTRRIEQFYNPEIVSGSGDKQLAEAYYSEPTQVNIIVNTPSDYWGYDYFYPAWSTGWYSPYWSASWRWGSPWYWNSWYDPYWAWGWGPSWG